MSQILPRPESALMDAMEKQNHPPNPSSEKPVVIGLYGISGSGKSTMLRHLQANMDPSSFAFYEGSEIIGELVPGGLEAFRSLGEQDKLSWRERAIVDIRYQCNASGRSAIVAGHFMFPSADGETFDTVYTEKDLDTYTHIVYVEVDSGKIEQRRRRDEKRVRPLMDTRRLEEWQRNEITSLRSLCRERNILFLRLKEEAELLPRMSTLMQHFRQDTPATNWPSVKAKLDGFYPDPSRLDTMLVMDADKTLAAIDTGDVFWEIMAQRSFDWDDKLVQKQLFGGPMGYSETAFRQAALLTEEVVNDEAFEVLCRTIAGHVKMHPEFVSLLASIKAADNRGALVVTCGLGRVWERVFMEEGLSEKVHVVGGGRVRDGYVVTAETKAAIVCHFRDTHHLKVWAFGDGPLDLPMLREATEAIVVVGDEETRSKSMEAELRFAIVSQGLRVRQVLLGTALPRLYEALLPQVRLNNQNIIESILLGESRNGTSAATNSSGFKLLHATDKNATKLMMSPMRDASISGPQLRDKHEAVGKYLALEYLSEVLDVEEYPIQHVQGHVTEGFRLRNEAQTTIVALMRGGEPMALGVNAAYPSAMFVHASSPKDVKLHHLEHQKAIILVDSVINTGKTIIQFIEHIQALRPALKVVVMAGVVQAEVVSDDHTMATALNDANASLIALRLSQNKFTGAKTTDTGNRLYNTTHLP